MSQTLLLSGNNTDFTTNILPPIQLENNERYEATLLSIDLYNSIPDITEKIINFNIQVMVEKLGKL